jgi:uncharacterized membrane protein/uncharacterized membrane-anchored protein
MSLPKGFRDWLARESSAWRTEGLLTDDQRERILARYPEAPTENGALAFALRTLGVLLFGAAILLVISHNWAEFSQAGQLTTVFAALAVIQGAGLWCFHTGRERGATIGHLLGCIMYGAGIALIGQIYHLDAHAPDALLAWCVFTLPFALILDATVLHLGVIALAGSWMLMEADHAWFYVRRDQLHHGERLAFLLLLLPTAFAAYRRARPALTGALAWSFIFLWFLFNGRIPVHIFVLPLVLAALHPTGDPRGRGFRFIGAAGVAFILLALGSLHGSMHRDFGDAFLRHDPLYTLATAALAGWAIHRARARQDSHAGWMGLVALLTLSLGFLGALDLRGFRERETIWVLVTAIANVTTLLLAVALIRQGLAESRLRPYVYGAIVFLTWLFWRYADIEKELGYLGMAGIFLLLGLVLFVLAKIWRQPREPALVEAMPEFRPAWFEARLAALVPHRRTLLAGALALQFAVLGWMVYDHSRPMASGERFLVLCEPVDPRDLTKGDYVTLSYGFQSFSWEQYASLLKEWERLHPSAQGQADNSLKAGSLLDTPDRAEFIARRFFEQNIPKDTPIYFPLSKGPEGIAVFGDPTFTLPPTGAFLRARTGRGSWGWNRADVRAGIESFYIKEGTGAKWEKLRNQSRLLAEIAVLPNGQAGLVALKEVGAETSQTLPYRLLEQHFYQGPRVGYLQFELLTDRAAFDKSFHPAPLNGRNAVAPDFAREWLISLVDKETDRHTEISVVAVERVGTELVITLKVIRGEKQTFTTIPQSGIIVSKEGLRHVTIREQGGTNRVLRRLNPPR